MAKLSQLRRVPDDLHRKLKARAAAGGLILSDCLVREVKMLAESPAPAQLQARIAGRPSVRPRESAARAVRAERNWL